MGDLADLELSLERGDSAGERERFGEQDRLESAGEPGMLMDSDRTKEPGGASTGQLACGVGSRVVVEEASLSTGGQASDQGKQMSKVRTKVREA